MNSTATAQRSDFTQRLLGLLPILPAPRKPATTLRESVHYAADVAAKANDLACALGSEHRLPVSFAEIAQRDTELGDHCGQGARHRKPGAPCSDVTRSRRWQSTPVRFYLSTAR